MHMYKITNEVNEKYYIDWFSSRDDCKHWVINTLDLSLEWSVSKIDFKNDLFKTSEDNWWNMLETLPPLRIFNEEGVNGFLMSEYETELITRCYCEYKGDYYLLFVSSRETDLQIISKLKELVEKD